mmetsp:Transcript_19761/g.40224  ORF Transcript_19761/g.40224 Transcript_19761/m.40224 type:complete len:780 (+) Transcript_19761:78-2417(+)
MKKYSFIPLLMLGGSNALLIPFSTRQQPTYRSHVPSLARCKTDHPCKHPCLLFSASSSSSESEHPRNTTKRRSPASQLKIVKGSSKSISNKSISNNSKVVRMVSKGRQSKGTSKTLKSKRTKRAKLSAIAKSKSGETPNNRLTSISNASQETSSLKAGSSENLAAAMDSLQKLQQASEELKSVISTPNSSSFSTPAAATSSTAPPSVAPTIRTRNPNPSSGSYYQRLEMMEHTILTKEEEIKYGRQVVKARELKIAIEALVEERQWAQALEGGMFDDEGVTNSYDLGVIGERARVNGCGDLFGEDSIGKGLDELKRGMDEVDVDYEFLSYELEYLSLYGFRPSWIQSEGRESNCEVEKNASSLSYSSSPRSIVKHYEDEHNEHMLRHISQLRNHPKHLLVPNKRKTRSSNAKKLNGKSIAFTMAPRQTSAASSYTPLLHLPLHLLTEHDIVTALSVAGGKKEAINILLDGAYAREILMRKNVKLVVSISKQWLKNSFSTQNANLGGVNGAGSGGKGSNRYLSQMYEGSWDRPSLDEAVQEGMLGLARAVDKYDPERGLRFSTYATHWITSYVRVCFQRAVTGCLRVPSQLHDIKSAYKKIIKDHLSSGETPPAQKHIAKELGISEQRLTTAIRVTGGLISVDAPIVAPGSGTFKGSAAGGDGSNSQELLILDTLKCAEPKPEDQVEISFLRQCLENAMATELTPHERDILRLRLGLDSGEGKTVREVVEMCGGSVTMSDVRSAERRAFKKLRSPKSVHTHNLLAYLDIAGVDRGSFLSR